jgi:uncharacterized cysteine cluster protein YcgN (CxxCxxCC family)
VAKFPQVKNRPLWFHLVKGGMNTAHAASIANRSNRGNSGARARASRTIKSTKGLYG